ncbi:MAG: hypothetical protein K0Q59_4185 [Paenibacillus sp.]|jgi:hypothetical protein|nr:hypothetical protein [Paenibacillus sp.]
MTEWLTKEREIKLDILQSLARSQRALARILESAADTSGAGSASSDDDSLRKSIEAIERHQLVIMEKLCGITLGEVKASPPAAPWTNGDMHVTALFAPEDMTGK